MTPADADILAERSDFVFTRASQYPDGFNPVPFHRAGRLRGDRAVVKHTMGRDDLDGVRVAVQGVGLDRQRPPRGASTRRARS